VENSEKEIEANTVKKQKKSEKSAQNKKQLTSTVADKAEYEKLLKSTEKESEEKNPFFAEKQKLRKEELAAIAKVIEILSSFDVSGNAVKYLSLAQA